MTTIHQIPASNRVMNLAHFVTRNARRFPDRIALRWRDRSWTWAQFDARVSAMAGALIALGVGPGEGVLVHSRNSNALLESMLATFRIGAVWVPTNFRLLPADVVRMVDVAKPKVFLCQDDFPRHAEAVREASSAITTVWLEGDAVPDASAGLMMLEDLMRNGIGEPIMNAPVERDSPCWLFFTSGTTGLPKAAVLTHGQMGFVITNHLCDLMPGLTENDGSLVLAPLSHGAGVHQLGVIARGGQTVLIPGDGLDPDEAFSLIARHGLTNLFTVPTIVNALVGHEAVDRHDHTGLRYVVYAGAPMYREDQKRALRKLGSVLVQYYGLGEVTGNITVLPPRDHEAEGEAQRVGSCGYERTGMQVSVQDEDGCELGPGQSGEICVIGPAVFAGYFDNPQANAKAFRNGWFRTGDIGYRDEQGYLYLTGRASDMYISGGSNIHPREIEEKILMHPAIEEVAVVGVPDLKWGEVGVAVCVVRPGLAIDEAELLAWLSEWVARYKLPKRIHFLDALPRSGYGKVPRNMVRELLRERGLLPRDS